MAPKWCAIVNGVNEKHREGTLEAWATAHNEKGAAVVVGVAEQA